MTYTVMAAPTEPSSSSKTKKHLEQKRGPKSQIADHTINSACEAEHKLSLDCIARNNFKDTTPCEPEFQNYRNCKKFWTRVQWRRFFRGQRPTLPLPEDRAQALVDHADYMEKVLADSPEFVLKKPPPGSRISFIDPDSH